MKIIRSSKTGDGWDVLVEEGATHVLLHFTSEPTPIVITDTLAGVIAARKADVPPEDPLQKVALIESKLAIADSVLTSYAADKSTVGDKARQYFASVKPVEAKPIVEEEKIP